MVMDASLSTDNMLYILPFMSSPSPQTLHMLPIMCLSLMSA